MRLGNMSDIHRIGKVIIFVPTLILFICFMSRYDDQQSELNQALTEFQPHICKETLPYSRDRFNTTFIICMKNPNRCPEISMSFFINGYARFSHGGGTSNRYEEHLINIWLVLIKNYPEAVVLDFGSNIGAYTLVSRKMGNKVIALDPDPENQAILYNSLLLNQLEPDTFQLRNAISDVYDVYYGATGFSHGFMNLVDKDQINNDDKKMNSRNTWSIKSIKLNDIFDLIPEADTYIMKIDIQGFECRALTSYLKENKKRKFLAYILLETVLHCKKDSTTPCNWEEEFLPLLESSGYIPHVPYPITYKALKFDCYYDVLFVHKDAKSFPYLDSDLAAADFRHVNDIRTKSKLIKFV